MEFSVHTAQTPDRKNPTIDIRLYRILSQGVTYVISTLSWDEQIRLKGHTHPLVHKRCQVTTIWTK